MNNTQTEKRDSIQSAIDILEEMKQHHFNQITKIKSIIDSENISDIPMIEEKK